MTRATVVKKQKHLRDILLRRRFLLQAARKGNPNAQIALGDAHRYGTLYPKNAGRGVAYYRKAAQPQNRDWKSRLEARFHLAVMSLEGDGCPRNPKQSAATFIWISRTSHERANECLLMAADMYALGQDVPQSYDRALFFLNRLAGRGGGEEAASRILGIKRFVNAQNLYDKGVGLFLDYEAAGNRRLGTNLIAQAAELGHPAAVQDTVRIVRTHEDFNQMLQARAYKRLLEQTEMKSDVWPKWKPGLE